MYNATASLKTAAGVSITAPVIISTQRLDDGWQSREGGRRAEGGRHVRAPEAARDRDGCGLPPGGAGQRLRSASARTLPVGDGKLVTLATAQPVFHIGGGAPDAKPTDKAGYDVAVVIFQGRCRGQGRSRRLLARREGEVLTSAAP